MLVYSNARPARLLGGIFRDAGLRIVAHPADVLSAALAPMMLSGAMLYTGLHAYLWFLTVFLHNHSPAAASLAFVCLGFSFFVWLFFCVLAMGRLARVLGQGVVWRSLGRLYAAAVRFSFALGSLVLLLLVQQYLAIAASPYSLSAGLLFCGLGIALFSARCGVLLVPVAVHEDGYVLRRAYELSHGLTLQMGLVWAVFALAPAILVQLLCEWVLRQLGISAGFFDFGAAAALTAQRVLLLEGALGEVIAVATLAMTVSLILIVSASLATYDALTASEI